MKNKIVFYHGKCHDGFGAAYSAWKSFGDSADYYPLTYNEKMKLSDLPDVTNKEIFILDFSFEKELYENISEKAASVKLYDHHQSAYKKLCGCNGCFFDLNRSGAMIAWNVFQPNNEPPYFIKLIQDRDLWKFNLPESKSFKMVLDLIGYDFKEWQKLEDPTYLQSKIEQGKVLKEFYDVQIQTLAKQAQPVVLSGINGTMVNSHDMFASDLGNFLCEKNGGFALIWSQLDNGAIKCGLRSTKDLDCSFIAEQYGGGGHAQACGFIVKNMEEFQKILKTNQIQKLVKNKIK